MTAEYGRVIKDSMVLKPPAWYKSLCVCEITFQAPLIFLCTYAFVLGGRRWIRIPAIIYGTHVATTLIPILAHIGYHDFTGETPQGPETLDDRLKVAGIYLPWFVWPALLVWRMCVSPFYSGQASATNKRKAH
ncbi:hypothetical protein BOX15_Mlig015329g1 [Macrostomum lignano]|nr:hypothetical protein BOX15_Mlig015329g3 [Macrostomum lignano]PAA66097.1 hypothetical protein BOX15_Mlig015329g1 [Macrostomum lignano]